MPSKSAEATPRTFDSTLAAGLTDEARKAVKVAFDAMSTWRTQIVNNEKNIEAVIDKIAAGAKALGWPEEIVGDAVEAEVHVSLQLDGQLARSGHRANESVRTLHAGRATVAKGMDGRDGPLDETLKGANAIRSSPDQPELRFESKAGIVPACLLLTGRAHFNSR